jgi:Low affinity iron permease
LQPGQEAAAILYGKMNEKAAKRADQTPRSFRCKVNDLFRAFSRNTASAVGSAWAFIIAITVIVVWAATGPMFHFSDTWQLIINTGTTIVTFLMVFLIQNTQNRDGKAIQLKLDELIRALEGARNRNSNRNSSGCTADPKKPTHTLEKPNLNAEAKDSQP